MTVPTVEIACPKRGRVVINKSDLEAELAKGAKLIEHQQEPAEEPVAEDPEDE